MIATHEIPHVREPRFLASHTDSCDESVETCVNGCGAGSGAIVRAFLGHGGKESASSEIDCLDSAENASPVEGRGDPRSALNKRRPCQSASVRKSWSLCSRPFLFGGANCGGQALHPLKYRAVFGITFAYRMQFGLGAESERSPFETRRVGWAASTPEVEIVDVAVAEALGNCFGWDAGPGGCLRRFQDFGEGDDPTGSASSVGGHSFTEFECCNPRSALN